MAIALAAAVFTVAATASSALGESRLTPGAVFTETNTAPNYVLAFNRSADGTLTAAGQFATGGDGRPMGNPPSGFPTLDSSGAVELSADGDNRSCLFVVNAGSNTVSSFRVRPDGLELADQRPTGGSRPISVTSTSRGEDKQLLYVLNSDAGTASIQGYYVSGSCRLTQIPGSSRPTSSPDSVPAQIRFDRRGRVLAVSERFANGGNGDIDIFPVDRKGVAGAPVVNASAQRTPYGLDFNNHDILSVANEDAPPPFVSGSTVTTYALSDDGTLTPLDTKPSPGAACWNVFTNNGKFLYVTKPLGQSPFGTGTNVDAFRVDRDGTMTLVDSQTTSHNALDDALSHDSRFLYVLSDAIIPPAPTSAINEFAIDPGSGALTPIGSVELPGSSSTAGLAAW
jgi:6-phosphogluconolactonase (cycloisomerase 2 family)